MIKNQRQPSTIINEKRNLIVNPITGVGGADSSSSYDDDQADSGGLQQVQTLPGDALVVATTVAAVSTITTTSSAVATSVSTSTVTVTSVGKGSSGDRGKKGKGPASKRCASDAASSSATTSVGKGSSGDRGKKGKGPASKRCAAGSTVSTTTAVHSASAGASLELADSVSFGAAEYCGFHICTSDWLDLCRMEDSFLCAVEEKAVTFFRSRIQESSLLRDDSVIEDFSELRDGLFSGLEADMVGFHEKYFAEVHGRVIFSHHLVDGEIEKFSTEEADRFRASFLAAIGAKVREYLALVWSLEISRALDGALCASERAQVAAQVAAARAAAAAARAAARAAASVPDTNPDPAPVVARDCDAAHARAASDYASTADNYAQVVAARAVAAQAHAAIADCFVTQARVADSSAPNPGSNFDLVLDSLVATALAQRADARAADARAAFAVAAAALAHARAVAPIPDTDPDPTCTRIRARNRVNAANKYARTTAALAAVARDTAAAADRAVDQARAADSSGSDLILNSLVAVALNHHADARIADARARAAADNAARAHAAVPISTDPDFLRARARARAADSRARATAARAAAARAAAVNADRVVAQARAAADRVAQSRAADSLAPDSNLVIASVGAAATAATRSVSVASTTDQNSARTATAAIAGSSTSSLLPGSSSPVPPDFADLFGFVVPSELSEVVNELISEVCTLAKGFYPGTLRIPFSGAVRSLSNSEQQCAWCLTNMKLYEAIFIFKSLASCFANLLPGFINRLCSVREWDSSNRSFLPLMGSRLRDFWASLDKAIFRALRDFFVAKWTILTARFSVPAFSSSVPGEVSSALCGGDFVDACAGAATSSSSPSIFGSITRGMGLQVAPIGGDSVNLFGFELPSEVGEMVEALIRETSALARRTYSSLVRVEVLGAMSKLSDSEKFAWLTANMMLYKTGFVARCLAAYSDELCPHFICSLFSVRPGDDSGRSLLLLTGNDLRDFYLSLVNVVIRTVEDIFVAEWDELTSDFSVPLGPGEESPSAVLCGRDFISAFGRAGVPALAISGLRKGQVVARRAISQIAEVASGSFASGSSSVSVDVLPVSGMTPEVSVVTEGSGDDVVFVGGHSLLPGELVDRPSLPLSEECALVVDVPTLTTTTTSSSLETPPLFIMGEEIGLSMVGVVASEVLVVTEGSGGDVIFIDDHSSVSEGELGDGLSLPLSDEHALVVDISPSEPSVLAREEVGLSMVGTSSSSSSSSLGVLGDLSSPSPSEQMVVPTTSASSVTSVEVEGSTTVTERCYTYGPKKSFASRYSADMTSSSGMPSSSISSGSGVSAGLLSSAPVVVGGVLPLAAGADGGDIGERLAKLLNRGLPPSPPPASEPTPTEAKASSSSKGSGGVKRKRKKKS